MPKNWSYRIKAKKVRRQREKPPSLISVYQKLINEFDVDSFLSRTAHLLRTTLTGIDGVGVFLYDDSGKKLKLISLSASDFNKLNIIARFSLAEKAFRARKPYLKVNQKSTRVNAVPSHDKNKQERVSLLCAPMVMKGNTCVGCIMILKENPKTFEGEDLILIKKVASLLGVVSYKVQMLRQEQEQNISNLIGTLSHELRTPLTSIKGYVTTLLGNCDGWSSKDRYDFLRIVDFETDRMNKLIRELLDSSMIESGLLSIAKEPVLLGKILRKAVDNAKLHNKNHRFIVSVLKNLPIIEADPDRIRQVLDNLLDNAIKYSPGGGLIVVRCTVEEKEVKVSVADEGIGIAPEHLNRLFERFYRIKSNTAGTGLGLPVASEIIRKHGGRIWAKSAPNNGSTFFFTLPLTEMNDSLVVD